MTIDLSIVGVVRFSVLTSTYYSERFPTLEEKAAHLFSPQRMELRLRVFERLCLRSIRRQTDQGFHLVVVTAEDMPVPYLERLHDLVGGADNITLLPVGASNHYGTLRMAYDLVPSMARAIGCCFDWMTMTRLIWITLPATGVWRWG